MQSSLLHRGSRPRTHAFRQHIQIAHTSSKQHRGRALHCRASAGAPLTLHIGETTLSFPFAPDSAQELRSHLQTLLQTFAAKQKAERPQRWQAMDYRLKGDPAARELELLELFCNPNAHQTAFDARVLITLQTGEGVKVTTEGRLSALKADLDVYSEQHLTSAAA